MNRILLAEDDPNLNFVITDHFEQAGFSVSSCKDGLEAVQAFNSGQFDIAILDIMMPRLDGFSLATAIRQKDEFIPILFLTARSQEEDRLKGFEIGGDDYITKPFSIKELILRVQVFLRRTGQQVSNDQYQTSKSQAFGQSQFDRINLGLKVVDRSFSLTEMEGQLLEMLLAHKNTLVKRSEILIKIWGEDDYFKGRSLDVFVSRLRKYLKEDQKIEIKNHHGVGFTLIEQPS